jgi:hypothetical protein
MIKKSLAVGSQPKPATPASSTGQGYDSRKCTTRLSLAACIANIVFILLCGGAMLCFVVFAFPTLRNDSDPLALAKGMFPVVSLFYLTVKAFNYLWLGIARHLLMSTSAEINQLRVARLRELAANDSHDSDGKPDELLQECRRMQQQLQEEAEPFQEGSDQGTSGILNKLADMIVTQKS